jgi:hypothetical protein
LSKSENYGQRNGNSDNEVDKYLKGKHQSVSSLQPFHVFQFLGQSNLVDASLFNGHEIVMNRVEFVSNEQRDFTNEVQDILFSDLPATGISGRQYIKLILKIFTEILWIVEAHLISNLRNG